MDGGLIPLNFYDLKSSLSIAYNTVDFISPQKNKYLMRLNFRQQFNIMIKTLILP